VHNDFGTIEIKNEILGIFWEGFSRGKPIYGLPRNRGLVGRAHPAPWRACAEQVRSDLLGTFLGILERFLCDVLMLF